MAASFGAYDTIVVSFCPRAGVALDMTAPRNYEKDRQELERALGAIRDARRRDLDSLYSITAVLGARSHRADRALRSAWFTLINHTDKPEFLETLCGLARTLLDQYNALDRAYRELDGACEAALAVFEPPTTE